MNFFQRYRLHAEIKNTNTPSSMQVSFLCRQYTLPTKHYNITVIAKGVFEETKTYTAVLRNKQSNKVTEFEGAHAKQLYDMLYHKYKAPQRQIKTSTQRT